MHLAVPSVQASLLSLGTGVGLTVGITNQEERSSANVAQVAGNTFLFFSSAWRKQTKL